MNEFFAASWLHAQASWLVALVLAGGMFLSSRVGNAVGMRHQKRISDGGRGHFGGVQAALLGLLALLLLIESRRPARLTSEGGLMLLVDQDRDRWNRVLIAEGQAIVRQFSMFLQVYWIDVMFALFTDKSQRAFELLSKTRVVTETRAAVGVKPTAAVI